MKLSSLFLLVAGAHAVCDQPMVCNRLVGSAPTLDADLSEWSAVEPYSTTLTSITLAEYPEGEGTFKCVYDDEKIYFAFEFPGDYRFNATDNHECAAIGTMMKVGADATFTNMGGCPDALAGCDNGVPDTCMPYLVDIGAHWELRTTEQGVMYDINTVDKSGNDLIANKDDEYGVSAFCRFDDDDADAGNEWAGAWKHTNPVDGEPGSYVFELSRTLATQSVMTDAQLAAGDTIEFGVAFWDPLEREVGGWTDSGHYLTGCGTDWITLELRSDVETPAPTEDPGTTDPGTEAVCDQPMVCSRLVGSAPTLDADLSEWSAVEPYSTTLTSITLAEYPEGEGTFKCVYDDEKIYFAFEFPGDYRFNATDNHECAAIGTMMKVGADATFTNMGGCPDALAGCDNGVPDTCMPYLVDIGAHWELRTTEQGVMYDINTVDKSGNDLIANKDDEYGVSAFCRFDDDDADAGNEWAGAWKHTNPVDGEPGSYVFELSRTLATQSVMTDAQLAAGDTIEFGVAFWDPLEREVGGWTDSGHYLTGCGTDWITLELRSDVETPAPTEDPGTTDPGTEDPGTEQPDCPGDECPRLSLVGNNRDPTSAFPLGLCEGDCDNDSDCEGELVCFDDEDSPTVPGCAGIRPTRPRDTNKVDYCYMPQN